MAILTDTDLMDILNRDKTRINKNDTLQIYPYDEEYMTPIGYDLRVGEEYSSALKGGVFPLKEGEKITLEPNDTVLITTLESIGMPQNKSISGFIVSKVSKVSKGLSHVSTTVDPDWEGPLLIALHNHSIDKVELEYGEPFCTVVFLENKSCATKDCCKIPGRKEILVNDWKESIQKAKKKDYVNKLVPPAIIVAALIFAPLFFGTGSGYIASVAGAVGLSQLSAIYLKVR